MGDEKHMSVFAITNQKGGSGKTTTAVNLAAAVAATNKKCLVVDLDPQGNTTTHFGISPEEAEEQGRTIYHALLLNKSMKELIMPSGIENLDLIPSSLQMAVGETQMFSAIQRERILLKALAPLKQSYDFIFLDCPPSLGVITLNALTAADEAIVAVQAEFFALDALDRLLDIFDTVRAELNPGLNQTVLLTMFDQRNKICRIAEEQVRKSFSEDQVYSTKIRVNVKLKEAPSHGKPIYVYAPESNGAVDYQNLAAELISRRLSPVVGGA